eukprot:TRINITY_DN32348_c0_g1_i1.p1 TRINITY_DN32348_c0_g1~~TRINITY_DN32348_c0_g1_i1.p1  ORF type:complete len:313 (-),score=64.83 TRINITY_DN32348_c0_g1_i1:235-1095(-)
MGPCFSDAEFEGGEGIKLLRAEKRSRSLQRKNQDYDRAQAKREAKLAAKLEEKRRRAESLPAVGRPGKPQRDARLAKTAADDPAHSVGKVGRKTRQPSLSRLQCEGDVRSSKAELAWDADAETTASEDQALADCTDSSRSPSRKGTRHVSFACDVPDLNDDKQPVVRERVVLSCEEADAVEEIAPAKAPAQVEMVNASVAEVHQPEQKPQSRALAKAERQRAAQLRKRERLQARQAVNAGAENSNGETLPSKEEDTEDAEWDVLPATIGHPALEEDLVADGWDILP